MTITLVVGDITAQDVDAIVNAANSSVGIGTGVTGAIFAAGGSGLREECRTLGGCRTGDAKATGGHALPARHVIHAVGPRWHTVRPEWHTDGPVWWAGPAEADRLLASAYRRAMEVAVDIGARTVAFPGISTGVYAFPKDRAAPIAVAAIREVLAEHPDAFDEVRLVAWSAADAAHYEGIIDD